MKDREFLIRVHVRLLEYGDHPDSDYMQKLRAVIKATPKDQETPNMPSSVESLNDLG